MLGRKLADVLVLQQIQSVFAMISYIKMLTSIEIIKAKRKKKKKKIAWNTVLQELLERKTATTQLQPDRSVSRHESVMHPDKENCRHNGVNLFFSTFPGNVWLS